MLMVMEIKILIGFNYFVNKIWQIWLFTLSIYHNIYKET